MHDNPTPTPYTIRDVAIATSLIPDEYLDLPLDDPKVVRLIEAVSQMCRYYKLQTRKRPQSAWEMCQQIARETGLHQRHAYRYLRIWSRQILNRGLVAPGGKQGKAWTIIRDWHELGADLMRSEENTPQTDVTREVSQ
jgi:hypothetical protein